MEKYLAIGLIIICIKIVVAGLAYHFYLRRPRRPSYNYEQEKARRRAQIRTGQLTPSNGLVTVEDPLFEGFPEEQGLEDGVYFLDEVGEPVGPYHNAEAAAAARDNYNRENI
jgi:hypothetical protein